jgi:hypothetical protein
LAVEIWFLLGTELCSSVAIRSSIVSECLEPFVFSSKAKPRHSDGVLGARNRSSIFYFLISIFAFLLL